MAKDKPYVPEPPDKYKGKQVILNSDRLLFNAKEDSVLIFSKKAIGLSSAGTLNFDSDKEMIVSSPKIYLGVKATEPLLLGNSTVDLLKEVFTSLNALSIALSKMKIYVGDVEYIPGSVIDPSNRLNATIEKVLTEIDKIKSKQNFTL